MRLVDERVRSPIMTVDVVMRIARVNDDGFHGDIKGKSALELEITVEF